MNFGQAVRTCLNNYANFSGRAQRSEYWYFFLFIVIANIATSILDAVLFDETPVFYLVATLALLVPSISAGVRRLHDLEKSGWWLLIGFIPLIGAIILIVFFCQRGTVGPNQFGPDPLQASLPDTHAARA
ncbi:uncharacterized membrane protein YhaH (DUF805 family) [Microvirga flocculans]|uniref:Uncharacterized membrane protein YhaH (DUF805 family) n=1 Tax=Microvirga flocculans TaxID=217168 RepID=A0A7W6IDL7_9HYPH|nr:DUF805 domain-containing protein [Microvirga flocculans]MBB4039546.1 uncharacterized membrane protein YhaH (DUF805 family) [Microvirga flocculans]